MSVSFGPSHLRARILRAFFIKSILKKMRPDPAVGAGFDGKLALLMYEER